VVAALLAALVTAGLATGGVALSRAVAGDGPAADRSAATTAAAAAAGKASVAVADLNAVRLTMRKSRGRTLLVHFWASWCLPCLQELPVINRFALDMKAKGGVDVLSLSLDNPDAVHRVEKLLNETAPALTPTIVKVDDADAFITAFDARWEGSIPALFAYDGQGRLRARHIGEATRRELDRLVADASNTAKAK
jgi:thiol-disulfide isomerase/thioredoxin